MTRLPNHMAEAVAKALGTSKKTAKYKNQKTAGYDSKKEYSVAVDLLLRKNARNGDVLDWLEQVPIKLPGGLVYRCDFLVFMKDGTWELIEVKGFSTKTWKIKLALLKESRPELHKRLRVV